MSKNESTDWMTTREVAKQLRVNPQTVNRWRKQGCPCLIAGAVRAGKNLRPRFKMQEVENWLRTGTAAGKEVEQ